MNLRKIAKTTTIIQIILLLSTGGTSAMSFYVHYMPWFQTMGRSGAWTHWGDTIPRQTSHFTPLIGLYDSRDPDVLEYQVLEMKYAGLDGLLMDWYGINNGLPEYGTQPIFAVLTKASMKYGIVWEDRYANNQGGATPVLQFMENNFFKTGNYLKTGSSPVLLVWQVTYMDGTTWQNNLNSVTFQNKPVLLTRDNALTPGAQGAYSWINAAGGTSQVIPGIDYFLSQNYTYMIPTALPRFVDDYSWGSYGTIDDQNGQTFVNSMNECIASGQNMIQIATWNDWQEGTIIEPSVEYQYRDLQQIQSMRKKNIDANFSYTLAQLTFIDSLFRQRRQFRGNATETARLDSTANALYQGNPALASKIFHKQNTAVAQTGFKATAVAPARAKTVVFDLRGRKVGSIEFSHSNENNLRNASMPGVYVLKKSDGAVSTRFLGPAR
jgi:hypothetical protein